MRKRRIVSVGVVAVLGILLVVGLAALVLVESRWGMERVRRFGLGLVNDNIPGSVEVARIDGPGLLAGLVLFDIVVRDPDGQVVLDADSARISYDWRSFIRRRPVFDNLRIFGLDVRVAKEPGEDAFGIQRAFTSEQPADTASSGAGIPLEVHDVELVDASLLVRQPVDGPAAEDDRFVTETVAGGAVRIFTFDDIQAALGTVLVGGPDSRVTVDLDRVTLEGRVLREPFRLADARGRVTLRDSTLLLDLPVVELPDSRAGVEGTVTLGTDQTRLALQIDARDIALADIGWVDPRVPDRGTFAGILALTMDTLATSIDGRELRLALNGSRVSGSGGVLLGDPLRFTNVDLTLSPVELATVEELLDREVPLEGNVTGRITADGALPDLATTGTLQLRPRGAAQPARVRWDGRIAATDDPVLRDLDLDIQDLDASVVASFVDNLELAGTIDADIVASGPIARGVTLEGTITHRAPAGAASTVAANGSIGYDAGRTTLALDLGLQPLQLQALAPLSPRLETLTGEATGTVRLTGPLDDLAIVADVATPAGGVTADMRIAGTTTRSFSGFVTVDRLRPGAVVQGLPDLGATGRVTFDITGTDPATMHGTIGALLDSASYNRVELGPVRADARIADGVLTIDTLVADAPGTVLHAVGSIGLVENASGTLNAQLTIASLQPLEPFLFEEESADPTVPRLDGRGTADVRLAGSIRSFTLDATASVESLTWQQERMFGIEVAAEGQGVGSDSARIALTLRADSAAVMGHEADSTLVTARFAEGAIEVQAFAGIEGRRKIAVEGTVRPGQDSLAATLSTLALGDGPTAWHLTQPAHVVMRGPVITVDSVRLERESGAGLVAASGRIVRVGEDGVAPTEPLDFQAALAQVPLGEIVRFAGIDVETSGTVGGALRLTGSPGAPLIDGDLNIVGFALDDAVLDSLGARVDYADQRLDVRTQAYRGGRRVFFANGEVPIDLRLAETGERRLAEDLSLTFQADSMPARFLLGFVDALENVEGMLDGQVIARGTTREPELEGAMSVRQGAVSVPIVGVRYRNVTGVFNFVRGTEVGVDLRARAVPITDPDEFQGAFRVTGDVDLAQPANPGFDLDIQAQELLAANRRDVSIVVSGQLDLTGAYRAPVISGDLTVESGEINIDELYRQYLVVGLEDPLLFDVIDTTLVSVKRVLPESENPFISNLRLTDFNVTVGQGSWLRSREMNVEVTGQLNVLFSRVDEDLVLTGTLSTVRGTYRLEYPGIARVFDVREGTVDFPGTPGVNPNLNVTAVYRVRTQNAPLDIYARVQGTLENPRVSLESDADVAISQSDLASYLFIGVPSYAIGSGVSSGSSGFGEAAAQSFTFGYLSAGLQSLAQNIGLVDYIGLSAAEPTTGSSGPLQNTQIELGRYITPDLFVVYTQRLGNENATPDIRLEWRLNDNYTAEIYAEDRFARTPSFGLSQITNARKVFGFLLYRTWGY